MQKTVVDIYSAVVAEIGIVQKLIKVLFDLSFWILSRNMIRYDKCLVEFALLKGVVRIDSSQ